MNQALRPTENDIDGLLERAAESLCDDSPNLAAVSEELTQLAHGLSDAGDRELAGQVAFLVDLLTIATLFDDEQTPQEHQREAIIESCWTTIESLREVLRHNPDGERELQACRTDAQARWGEYLELLPTEERCRLRPDGDWTGSCDDLWMSSDQGDTDEQAFETPAQSIASAPLDIDMILSSLSSIQQVPDQKVPDRQVPDAEQGTTPDSEVGSLKPYSVTAELPNIDRELMACYIEDAHGCLASMEHCLLQIESSSPVDKASLRQFCRELHTLKGASGTIGLSDLAAYVHELEDRVEAMENGAAPLDVDLLLSAVDTVRLQVRVFQGETPPQGSPSAGSPAHADNPRQQTGLCDQRSDTPRAASAPSVIGEMTATDREGSVRMEVSRLDRMMDLLAELVMLRNRRDTDLCRFKGLHRELNSCVNRLRLAESRALEQHAGPVEPRLARSFDELSNDIAELGRSMQESFHPFERDNSSLARLIGQFRQELMELRRFPVAGLFRRLQRAARDAARIEGKQVEVVFEGQGTRAERSLQERLFEPLMHLVRNAVSHGIEAADERRQVDKPAVGKLLLKAHSDATTLFIEVSDDGCGLNEEALERRGRELGLLLPSRSTQPQELWKLIFHPGFSTRAHVNEVAGRGVGMDVVATRIRQLRGELDVDSTPGRGTLFRLQIPLRSPIEHAMIVRVGEQLFALPMQSVFGTGMDETRTRPDGPSETPAHEVVPLRELLGLHGQKFAHRQVLTIGHHRVGENRELGEGTRDVPESVSFRQVSIAVDAVVGIEEVVVRSLPPMLYGHELFAGVTLSGNAETVLLFDVPRLVEVARNSLKNNASAFQQTPESIRQTHRPINPGVVPNTAPQILVVDDSLTARRHLVRKLQCRGFETTEACDGIEALERLRERQFSAVVTDLDMPRMMGQDLLREIERKFKSRQIPVIVVTGRSDSPTLDQVRRLGATEVFLKPATDATAAAISDILLTQNSTSQREHPSGHARS